MGVVDPASTRDLGSSAAELLNQAQVALASGDRYRALTACTTALSQEPKNVFAIYLYAVGLAVTGSSRLARSYLEQLAYLERELPELCEVREEVERTLRRDIRTPGSVWRRAGLVSYDEFATQQKKSAFKVLTVPGTSEPQEVYIYSQTLLLGGTQLLRHSDGTITHPNLWNITPEDIHEFLRPRRETSEDTVEILPGSTLLLPQGVPPHAIAAAVRSTELHIAHLLVAKWYLGEDDSLADLFGVARTQIKRIEPRTKYSLETVITIGSTIKREDSLEHTPGRETARVHTGPSWKPSRWTPLIRKDLEKLPTSPLTVEALDETERECPNAIRIKIKGNAITEVRRTSEHVDMTRALGYLALLQDTLKVASLPDTDFIVSCSDWPISDEKPLTLSVPVFSFCKTVEHNCLLLPVPRFARDDTGFITDSPSWPYPTWDSVFRQISALTAQHPWDHRRPVALFAGMGGGRDLTRLHCLELALQHEGLLKVCITYVPEYQRNLLPSHLQTHIGGRIPTRDYGNFRYLLHLDGVTASDRLRTLLAFGGTVLKQESPFYEFYYPLLIPGEHYLPIAHNLRDLVSRCEFLNENPNVARQIALQGRSFVEAQLTYRDVLAYTAEVVRAYTYQLSGL